MPFDKLPIRISAATDIYIYGAGGTGRNAYDALWDAFKKIPAGFIDSDPRVCGQHLLGVPCYSPRDIPFLRQDNPKKNFGVVISSETHFSEMLATLEKHNLKNHLLADFPFSPREVSILFTHPSLTYCPPIKLKEGCNISGQNIKLGPQTVIGCHTHLHGNNLRLGSEVTLGSHVSLGENFSCQGKNNIANNVRINNNVTIGKCTNININSFIGNNVTIGNFVSSGHNAVLGATIHQTETLSSSEYIFQPHAPPTSIGHDVWIGAGAVIKCGVTIGTGSIIGANAFVNKDLPPYSVAVGSPARIIRQRFSMETCKKLLDSRWWETSELENMSLPDNVEEALTMIKKLK